MNHDPVCLDGCADGIRRLILLRVPTLAEFTV